MGNDLFSLRPLIDDNRRDINELQRDFGSVSQKIEALNQGIDRNYEMTEEGFSRLEKSLTRYEMRNRVLLSVAIALSLAAIVIACIEAI